MCAKEPVGGTKVSARHAAVFSSGMYTEGVTASADQKLMALPKEAAKFASLKASDTVWRRRRRRRAG